jgi:hypothetical protein
LLSGLPQKGYGSRFHSQSLPVTDRAHGNSAKDVKGGIAGVVGKEAQLFDDLSASAAEKNEFVNQLRDEVRAWREAGWPGTAVVTRRLLDSRVVPLAAGGLKSDVRDVGT